MMAEPGDARVAPNGIVGIALAPGQMGAGTGGGAGVGGGLRSGRVSMLIGMSLGMGTAISSRPSPACARER